MDILSRLFCSDSISPGDKFAVMVKMFGGQSDKFDYHTIGLNQQFLMDYLFLGGSGTPTRYPRSDSFRCQFRDSCWRSILIECGRDQDFVTTPSNSGKSPMVNSVRLCILEAMLSRMTTRPWPPCNGERFFSGSDQGQAVGPTINAAPRPESLRAG